MRTIYLQHALSLNGRSALKGRHLVDRLREISENLLLGHVIMSGTADGVDASIRNDVISEVQMLKFDPDVIFLEGGLFAGQESGWRIEQELAREFVEKGGTLIVADVDLNTLRQERLAYQEAAGFLGAVASFRGREPVAGYDESHFWRGPKQILCRSEDMIVADWLQPVYAGIPEILCGLPVRLASWGSILASGNKNSTRSDATDGIPGPDNLPFASVHKEGEGFVALICANVTGDAWLEGCPHNTAWLIKIAEFLSRESGKDRRRLSSALKSQDSAFLSHAHEDKETVAGVCRLLTSEHGVGVWLDQQELIPGDTLPERIKDAIENASIFVLFWSAAAAESEWVRLELEAALSREELVVLVVRLDDNPVGDRLANLLRIEAIDRDTGETARQISRAIELRRRRKRIDEARGRGKVAGEMLEKETPVAANSLAPGESFTRSKHESQAQRPQPFSVVGTLSQPKQLATIQSTYRIDILSYFDAGTLVAGSGDFKAAHVEEAIKHGLIDSFQRVNCQTGMDGHLDDHLRTRRHLLYGYHEMNIFDRTSGDIVASFECDSGASVASAAWSPTGDRIIVGSVNYLTIADDRGRVITHKNMWEARKNSSPKSVAWQPSTNPLFATGTRVCIADPDGNVIHELMDLKSQVVAVAISPCNRFIAGTAMDGQTAVWSESGELLAILKGFGSSMGWHASRCLAFSPDSCFLAQAACCDSEGFLLLELASGKTARTLEAQTNLLAFHPTLPGILVTAGADRIAFWRTHEGG